MTTVEYSTLALPTSPVAVDPLPPLRSAPDLHSPIDLGATAAEGIDAEMAENLAYGHVPSVLPYLLQSRYGRDLVPIDHTVAVLTNDRLHATFLLGWGGRLWSLIDKTTGRELLYANAALQPANLALRDAWFAGGVEWNLGTTGHHPLTCEPLHAARTSLPDGTPGLRQWEYERLRELVVQLDVWLPADEPALCVQVTVTNVNAHDVAVYWWSNTAVPQTVRTRVLAPAAAAFRFDATRTLRRVAMPVDDGIDRSYPSRSATALDYFFDLEPTGRPWIAAVDGTGYGLLQTSSPRLRGRKLFVWGTGPGGQHWQDWLSPRGGQYLEVQAGLARTQLEHLPLPPFERWSWLETYGPVTLDPAAAHGAWAGAVAAGAAVVGDRTAWFERQARTGADLVDQPPGARLQHGSGWGALEARRRAGSDEGWPALPGTPFTDDDLGAEQQPWLAVLGGREPVWDGGAPGSYQTAPGWRSLLERASGPYAALHRGVARWVAGDRLGAVDAWEESLRAQPSAVAWRNIAVAFTGDDHERSLAAYREARSLDPTSLSLAVEHLELLITIGHAGAALAEIDSLPAPLRSAPAVLLAEARAAVLSGDGNRAGRILEPGLLLPGVREGAELLGRLWVDYRALDVGRAAAEAEDLPYGYDFRMG